MDQLFVILMRILFPRDPVARCRELMRRWLDQVIDNITDPEEIESLAYWREDRAALEGVIAFLEYFMRVLIHARARQMLGLQHIHLPLQPHPPIRNPTSMGSLFQRITQLARDFHTLDALAARRAKQMQRETDSNPLRLDATHQSTSPTLCVVEANSQLQLSARFASTSALHWGRWIGASSRRDGGGGASSRGPPKHPIVLESVTLAPEVPLPRSHPHMRS